MSLATIATRPAALSRPAALPMISVVTPSFNQGRFIERCIQSVLAQQYPRFEHIIYDNCSSDGTLDVLRRYPHLDWVRETDRGQSAALNKAFRKSRGEIIAWLNADDYYMPGAFDVAARELSPATGAMVLVGRIQVVDASGCVLQTTTPHFAGHDALVDLWSHAHGLSQPGMFFRRAALARVGLLDERLHYAMDYDLWLRLTQHFPLKIVDALLARFVLHPQSKTGQARYFSGFWREAERSSRRYWGSPLRPRYWRLARSCNRFTSDALVREILDSHKHERRLKWNLLGELVRRRPLALCNRYLLGVVTERLLAFGKHASISGGAAKEVSRGRKPPETQMAVLPSLGGAKGLFRPSGTLERTLTPLRGLTPPANLFRPAGPGGRVTVVIPTYNRAALVQRAIASVQRQTVRRLCDIVVVDDGSTDGTAEVLSSYGSEIRLLRQPHAGVSDARNAALRGTCNEFVAFLDSDDEWAPDKIERQLDVMRRFPAAVLVAAHGARRTAAGEEWSPALPPVPCGQPVDLAPHLFGGLFLLTSGVLVRARHLPRCGPFCTSLRMCEDYLLWLQLACRGPAIVLREPLVSCGWNAPASLANEVGRVKEAQVRARYLARRELRQRPDCAAAWRAGLARLLAMQRDAAYRAGQYALAARLGFRSLLIAPRGRRLWEWGLFLRALLRPWA